MISSILASVGRKGGTLLNRTALKTKIYELELLKDRISSSPHLQKKPIYIIATPSTHKRNQLNLFWVMQGKSLKKNT